MDAIIEYANKYLCPKCRCNTCKTVLIDRACESCACCGLEESDIFSYDRTCKDYEMVPIPESCSVCDLRVNNFNKETCILDLEVIDNIHSIKENCKLKEKYKICRKEQSNGKDKNI